MAHIHCSDAPSSEKWICMWSTCQGLDANVERYRNSPLMHHSVPEECKPAVYDYTGVEAVFPEPTKSIPKPRIHWSESKKTSGFQDPRPAGRHHIGISAKRWARQNGRLWSW